MSAAVTSESAPVVERYARERAWLRFLVEVRLSLAVWELDEGVRGELEPVTVWIGRCRDELTELTR
jgi:hypothetical protein